MAHIDLEHAAMKPAPIVKFEIAQHQHYAKTMLYGAIAAALSIILVAALFVGH